MSDAFTLNREVKDTAVPTIMSIPRIKICGVTLNSDLEFIAKAGVDTIGINFVPNSKRRVDLARGVTLARSARTLGLKSVAVLMDHSPAEIRHICESFPWDFVQLHGMESPDVAAACQGIAIIKATGWSGLEQQQKLVENWQSSCDRSKCVAGTKSLLAAFLVDAYAPGLGGGSGELARWDLIYPRPKMLEDWPLILAGGLTPMNVAQAIGATRVLGVDVASGVELQPGLKSSEHVVEFVQQANLGFAS